MTTIIILSIVLYILVALVFLFALLKYTKLKNRKPEMQAIFSLVIIYGIIYCLLRACHFIVPESYIQSFSELSDWVIAVAVLNNIIVIIGNLKKQYSMDLRTRAGIMMLILFIEFVTIACFWSMHFLYTQAENVTSQQTGQYLNAVANFKATDIARLMKNNRDIVYTYANNSAVFDCVSNENIGKKCDDENIKDDLYKSLKSNPAVDLVVIFDKNGIVMGSSDASIIGQDWSGKEEFINHSQDGYFSDISPIKNGTDYNSRLVISAPITKNSVFVGVLSVHIKPDDFYDILENRTHLGETGESYLININKQQISPKRFTNSMFVYIDNLNADECVSNFEKTQDTISGIVSGYHQSLIQFNNSFGRGIVGASAIVQSPTKNIKWCVLVEMGQNEVQAPLRTQLLKATIIALVSLLVLIILFLQIFDLFFNKLLKHEKNN